MLDIVQHRYGSSLAQLREKESGPAKTEFVIERNLHHDVVPR